MIGYAIDHGENKREEDFTAVRGSFASHPVVKKIFAEQDRMQKRVKELKEQIARAEH
jgi:hypothetical protein